MKTKTKVRPGLSLSSQQIRSRLKNRTLEKQQPDNSSFIQDEELIKINNMNKVEREMAYRENLKEIEATQKRLEQQADRKKQKQLDAQIEKLAQERLKQLRDEKPTEKE